MKAFCTRSASSRSGQATTTPVGMPRLTSSACEGPDMTKNTSRGYVGVAELFDGKTLLARSEGTYFKLPAKTIADVDVEKETDVYIEDGVEEIDV